MYYYSFLRNCWIYLSCWMVFVWRFCRVSSSYNGSLLIFCLFKGILYFWTLKGCRANLPYERWRRQLPTFPSPCGAEARACGNIKPNLKEEKQLSMWRSQERAFQEVGRASPKAPQWRCLVFLRNSKEVRVGGAL